MNPAYQPRRRHGTVSPPSKKLNSLMFLFPPGTDKANSACFDLIYFATFIYFVNLFSRVAYKFVGALLRFPFYWHEISILCLQIPLFSYYLFNVNYSLLFYATVLYTCTTPSTFLILITFLHFSPLNVYYVYMYCVVIPFQIFTLMPMSACTNTQHKKMERGKEKWYCCISHLLDSISL